MLRSKSCLLAGTLLLALSFSSPPASAQYGRSPGSGHPWPSADLLANAHVLDDEPQPQDIAVPDIKFEEETLDNGLRVIYAPMDNAPVVHVRVFYHVGSKDETPDRQGFAHMFEHMMFRGSEHVASEEHMTRINSVGGSSNAFTSFDQTVYVNTVPSNALQMALWLEADRMSSFKVTEKTFTTERSVVNEEFLQRVANPPYGKLFIDFFALAFDKSHYKWTPIGDMDQLGQAKAEELQDFFDTYYAPNNAVLVIAGQYDVDEAKQLVHDYFGWIEKGPEIDRRSPAEPEQTKAKRKVIYEPRAPLARITMGYKVPAWGDDDEAALAVLGNVLGQGRSSRLYQALVSGSEGGGGKPPVANFAGSGAQRLEDQGMFLVSVGVLPGQDPDNAEQMAIEVIKTVIESGVSEEEIAKARTQLKLGLLNSRQTADSIAGDLADAAAFTGDANRVNTYVDLLDAVTTDDIQRVAKKYLTEKNVTVLQYRPGEAPAGEPVSDAGPSATFTLELERFDVQTTPISGGVQPMTDSPLVFHQVAPGVFAVIPHAQPLEIDFAGPANNLLAPLTKFWLDLDAANRGLAPWYQEPPPNYPKTAPVPTDILKADFNMGESFDVGPLNVVIIRDDRLPLIGFTLLMPGGGDSLEAKQAGLSNLTADLLTRGANGVDATTFDEQLEGLGITLSAGDGGDNTRLSGGFPKAALTNAAEFARDVLVKPNLDPTEFRNLKFRALAGLQQQLSSPTGVAGRELDTALYGDSPAGRSADPKTVSELTLDDVKAWQQLAYRPTGATLILAGDVSKEDATKFAETMLDGWQSDQAIDTADYTTEDYKRRIIVVDNPGGGQSSVRIGNRAFTTDSDEKYAASVATQILSGGIESRLNRAMRAEKGLTYGASGRFGVGRHNGDFTVSFDTRPATTGEAVATAFEVLTKMGQEAVTEEELAEAKRRVVGSLVLSTQTVGQLAGLRGSVTLNGYPLDYYDNYGDSIASVTTEDVQKLIATYGDPKNLTIVVVGPASEIVSQLEQFGDVTVVPMPLAR